MELGTGGASLSTIGSTSLGGLPKYSTPVVSKAVLTRREVEDEKKLWQCRLYGPGGETVLAEARSADKMQDMTNAVNRVLGN